MKETKEKEPFFTEIQITSTDYANEVKSKSEKRLQRCKIGLIIAAVAELIWVLIMLNVFKGTLMDIIGIIGLIITAAAYIIGGGLMTAFKATWRVSKAIGTFGWLCAPFPVDIFTGIILTIMAIILIPIMFIFIPLILVFLNFIQIKKNLKAAEEYLK